MDEQTFLIDSGEAVIVGDETNGYLDDDGEDPPCSCPHCADTARFRDDGPGPDNGWDGVQDSDLAAEAEYL